MTSTVRAGVASVIEAGTIQIRGCAGALSGLHPRRFPLDRKWSVDASFREILRKEPAGDLPYLPQSVVRGVLPSGPEALARCSISQATRSLTFATIAGRCVATTRAKSSGVMLPSKRPPKGQSKESGRSFGKRVRRTAPPVTYTSSQRFFWGASSRSETKTLS